MNGMDTVGWSVSRLVDARGPVDYTSVGLAQAHPNYIGTFACPDFVTVICTFFPLSSFRLNFTRQWNLLGESLPNVWWHTGMYGCQQGTLYIKPLRNVKRFAHHVLLL